MPETVQSLRPLRPGRAARRVERLLGLLLPAALASLAMTMVWGGLVDPGALNAGESRGGPAPLTAKAVQEALAVLGEVGPMGTENGRAVEAWRRVSATEPDALPQLFAALDHATPLGANWIRAAIETIADRALAQGHPLPTAKLEAFFTDRSHAPRARRLAYEWLVRVDAGARERLAPTLLDDPSVELRRDAVAQALALAADLAQKKETDAAAAAYLRALTAARDEDQVKTASDALKELGRPVDLAAHYGFVRHWRIVGPLDNTDKRGFNIAYPPEKTLARSGQLEGKQGPARWIKTTTKDELGQVDLNQILAKEKGVLAYAVAELDSPRDQPAEVRVGCENAIKIWLNGKLVFEREVYHALVRMDQYIAPIQLRKGRNELMIKVCQNEQTEAWAADWKFQLRVCDATGGAVPLEQVSAGLGTDSNGTDDKESIR